MGKLYDKYFKSKNENSLRFRRDMAKKICSHHLKYVTEITDEGDVIIGREGGCNIRDGEFIVMADGFIVFRTDVADLKAYELLSLEGAICQGPDKEHGGEYRSITVYYKYYR